LIRLFLILSLGVGCARPRTSHRAPDAAKGFPAGAAPRATLVSPTRIDLVWQRPAADVAGHWVEFTTPGADFVKLEVAWPERTAFTHADLAPDTTFIYRLVPFFGHASPVAAVRTGRATGRPPREAEGPLDEPTPPPAEAKGSVRSDATRASAAPANLTVTLAGPTTVAIRWRDRAADEDGYLVEMAQGEQPFQVCALLPADTVSFRKVGLPPLTELRFRVRAFALGAPSPLASATTPAHDTGEADAVNAAR
jgi:hypothetical protein